MLGLVTLKFSWLPNHSMLQVLCLSMPIYEVEQCLVLNEDDISPGANLAGQKSEVW